MDKQISLSGLMDELFQAKTKKKEFLAQMEKLIPWGEWVKNVKPCYYKGERGSKPYGLELMLRLYVLQNLYSLSDEGTVAEVIDSRAFSELCGVDSTLISAPCSTKNREKQRDSEAHSTKKGNTWYFGYKAHIGVDKDTGLAWLPIEGCLYNDFLKLSYGQPFRSWPLCFLLGYYMVLPYERKIKNEKLFDPIMKQSAAVPLRRQILTWTWKAGSFYLSGPAN